MSNPYSILLLSTAIINLTLAVYALRYYRSPGALAYSSIMTCLSLYSYGYAFELQADDLWQIRYWLNIEYLGIAFLPPLFILLAAQYTGMGHLLKSWIIVLLFLIGFTTLFLQYTNYGNLFYRELRINTDGPIPMADFVKGPWYWVHQAFANLMLLLSSICYIVMFRRTHSPNRIRALIMLLALDIPWIFYLIYLIGGSPNSLDLSPFSFSVTGMLTALGIFRYHLLEFVPTALDQVFNSMTDGLVIIDKEKCLVSFNLSASLILPELADMSKGKSVEPVFNALPCLTDLSDGYESDIDISRKGFRQFFHLKVAAVKTNQGKLTGWAILFNNITERKQQEMALLEIEKNLKELNASKDKFFALIAHDLRNAFHLIINMSDMIMENIRNDDKTAALRKGKIIYETSVNTFALLQNLLDWALMQLKGVTFNPVDLTLADLVNEEVMNLKTQSDQKDLTIRCMVDQALTIHGDKEMIKTVIRNLLSNAIKYSHPGGVISILAKAHDGMVSTEVQDAGVGMTVEEQNKLFHLEHALSKKGTASETGTGLGLKLCKEFIRIHGGDIRVTSVEGEGSIFSFTVPGGGKKPDTAYDQGSAPR